MKEENLIKKIAALNGKILEKDIAYWKISVFDCVADIRVCNGSSGHVSYKSVFFNTYAEWIRFLKASGDAYRA